MNKQMYKLSTAGGSIAASAQRFGFRVLLRAGVVAALLAAMLLGGCQRDDLEYNTPVPQEPVPSGFVRTEVKLSVDENRQVNTRATEAEEKSYDNSKVYVLVFDNDSTDPVLMQRPVKATVTEGRLYALLRASGDARNIYVVTGLRDAMNAALEGITDTAAEAGEVTFSDVNAILLTPGESSAGIQVGGEPPVYIPMCTERIDRTSGDTQGTATLTEISQPLKRIAARIDVECLSGAAAMSADLFQLEGVTLINGNRQGYVLPQATVTYDARIRYDEVTDVAANAVKGQIYLYEHNSTNAAPTMVVVRGKYKGGESGYYRLDLLNTTGTKPYDALTIDRNTRYTIKITEVKTSGYRTVEEAMENSAANNIEYDVNVDDGTSHDVVSNGEYFIGSTASEYILFGDGEQTVTIATISHNAPTTLRQGAVTIGSVASTGGDPSGVSNPFTGVYDGTRKTADLKMTLPAGLTSCTATLRLGTLTKTILISRRPMLDLTNVSEYLGDKFVYAERESEGSWITLSGEERWHRSRTFAKGPVTSADGKLFLHLEENLSPAPRRGVVYGHKGEGTMEQDRYRVRVDFIQRGTDGLIGGDFGGWVVTTTVPGLPPSGEYTAGLLIASKTPNLAYKTSNTANDPSIVNNAMYGRRMNVAAAALADPAEYPSFDYCARLNRDLNGNGKIDDDEMKWYMPATAQLLALEALRPQSLNIYSSSATEGGAEYKMAVYPEGSAIISYYANWQGGEKTSTHFSTRCVRDIPMVGYPRLDPGRIVNNESAPAHMVTSVSKRRVLTPSNTEYLPGGPYSADNQTVFIRFEVSGQVRPSNWADAYQLCIDMGEGWRLPTIREGILLGIYWSRHDVFGSGGAGWTQTEDDYSSSTSVVKFLYGSISADTKPQAKAVLIGPHVCIREIGANTGTATLKFDANGGGGSVADMTVYAGARLNLPSAPATMHKSIDGYNGLFVGWNTAPDGTGTLYPVGSAFEYTGGAGTTTTLYAHYLAFAPGNVVRNAADPSKLAFGESVTRGLCFQFGSLVGSDWVSSPWMPASISFKPAEYAGSPMSFTDIPTYTAGTSTDRTRDEFINAYPYVGYNAASGLGDICRYMSDKGMVPAGTYWRLPTGQEVAALAALPFTSYGDPTAGFTGENANGGERAVYGGFAGVNAPQSPTFGLATNPPAGSLFLPQTLYRSVEGGSGAVIFTSGQSGGHYRTSSKNNTAIYALDFYNKFGLSPVNTPYVGFAVRCVKATKPVQTYTLTYDGNGLTGGTAPTAVTGQLPGSVVTLSGVGTMVRTGYVFGGWNTQPDGNGTNHTTTYTITSDVTLYAKWAPVTYSIVYNDLNGAASPSKLSYNVTENVTLSAPGGRTGYNFVGWWTGAGGTGAQVNGWSAGSAVGSQTLYAKWTPIVYTISYSDLQGATHSNPTTYTIESPTITFSEPNSITGWLFGGWFNSPNGAGGSVPQIAPGSVGNRSVYANMITLTRKGLQWARRVSAPTMHSSNFCSSYSETTTDLGTWRRPAEFEAKALTVGDMRRFRFFDIIAPRHVSFWVQESGTYNLGVVAVADDNASDENRRVSTLSNELRDVPRVNWCVKRI